jgi:hypothetical protein
VLFRSWTLDHAIAGVRTTPAGVEIDVEDRGQAFMPTPIVVTRADGATERAEVPVDIWLGGARRHTVRLRGSPAVTRVEIDPGRRFAYLSRDRHRWEASR